MLDQSPKSLASHVVVLILGLAVGFLATKMLSENEDSQLAGNQVSGINEDEPRTNVVRRPRIPDSSDNSANKMAEKQSKSDLDPGVSNEFISPTLKKYALEGIAFGWASLRSDSIPADQLQAGYLRFEESVKSLPQEIGKGLAKDQAELDSWRVAIEESDAINLLKAADDTGKKIPWAILKDEETMNKFFDSEHPEKLITVQKDRRKMASALEDGATLEFGPGVFDLGSLPRSLRSKEKLSDLSIRGAGINNTLLVLNSDLSPGGDIERLHLKDCTIHCNNNYLFDQRRGAVAIEADRTRFIGFDMGAGGSILISANQCLAQFRDCRIEGGFSRASVGSGNLFRTRNALAARFSRCYISHIRINTAGSLYFSDCTLHQILDSRAKFAGAEGIALVGGSTSYFSERETPDGQAAPIKFDLNTIFPNWTSRMQKP